MNLIVQKFGGTSVSTKENRIKVIEKIIRKKENDSENKIIVVVSAMGRLGDPYATDTLLDMVDTDLLDDKYLDLLMSFGEIISSMTLANEITQRGYKVGVLTGKDIGIITDDNFGDAEIIDFNSSKIEESLIDKDIVVIPGFQGATIDGDITTLGRGGSDITATILGGYLSAKYVEIYTDVDGIMTADPRIVKDAKLIDKMTYSEVYQLAEDGAKVLHPKAIEIAQKFDIPVSIKNTNSNSEGTFIEEINRNRLKDSLNNNRKVISAITYKKDRTQIELFNKDKNIINALLADFIIEGISLDLINFFTDHKVFTIDSSDKNKVVVLLEKYNLKYYIVENCCKLACIGNKMRGVPGVMAKIYGTLSNNDIDILQTSDSYNTIWCLIKEEELEKSIIALHDGFELGE